MATCHSLVRNVKFCQQPSGDAHVQSRPIKLNGHVFWILRQVSTYPAVTSQGEPNKPHAGHGMLWFVVAQGALLQLKDCFMLVAWAASPAELA